MVIGIGCVLIFHVNLMSFFICLVVPLLHVTFLSFSSNKECFLRYNLKEFSERFNQLNSMFPFRTLSLLTRWFLQTFILEVYNNIQ